MTQSENNNQTSSLKLLPYEHNAKYYETDQMGIVHHSNYIRWMEEARMDMMEQLGIPYRKMEEEGIISPVVSVSCEYRSMTHFSDTVLIETKITKYNGIRLDLEYKITDKNTGELRSIGTSSHCFLDSDGKIVSLKRTNPETHACFKNALNAAFV